MLGSIPLTRAMQLCVRAYDGTRLQLAAPLDPNANDKGCAFGGSLVSLATLSCWGLARSVLLEQGLQADIYVQDSTIEYLAPVWTELLATAVIADDASPQAFIDTFRSRGRARLALCAQIDSGGVVAARMRARFVAKRREDATS